MHVRRKFGQRPDDVLDALLGRDASDEEDDLGVVRHGQAAAEGGSFIGRGDGHRADAVGHDVHGRGDADLAQALRLQRREREEPVGEVEAAKFEKAEVDALLQRLPGPATQEDGVERAMRREEVPQGVPSGGPPDLQVERVEGVVRVEDGALRQG